MRIYCKGKSRGGGNVTYTPPAQAAPPPVPDTAGVSLGTSRDSSQRRKLQRKNFITGNGSLLASQNHGGEF